MSERPRDDSGARILVVLDPASPDRHTEHSPVVARAVSRARRDGAALRLLEICYESSLTYGAFATRLEVETARNEVLDAATEKVVALQGRLARQLDVPVEYGVCWNHDRCAAILHETAAWGAEVVFKPKRDRSFILGLFGNVDWDLLRETSVPVWFVDPETDRAPEHGVVAAVDPVGDEPEAEEHFALDDAVFDHAKHLSDIYGAPLHVVHAYQIPRGITGFQGYAPIYPAGTLAGAAPVSPTPQMIEANREARDAVARRHGEAIQTFVDEHGIPLDDIEVVEGPTPDVIRAVAERKGAGLVVMGAGSKGRWQRLLGHVSAEPSLADAPCDVLVIPSARA